MEPYLIGPDYDTVVSLGLGGNRRIPVMQPPLNLLGITLMVSSDRNLRRKQPAIQITPGSLGGNLHAEFLPCKHHYRCSGPQIVGQAKLLRIVLINGLGQPRTLMGQQFPPFLVRTARFRWTVLYRVPLSGYGMRLRREAPSAHRPIPSNPGRSPRNSLYCQESGYVPR